ncbi:MAG: hypothetical protein HYV33_02465 [Candidatus Kerfeldbacteria bacterium]|nr:hypothetical protein [Candidatus Kerfeldbacteria bacterium]
MLQRLLTTSLLVAVFISTTPAALASTKATITLKANPDTVAVDEEFNLAVTLTNAKTGQRLDHKTVSILYRTPGKSNWFVLTKVVSNKNGRIKLALSLKNDVEFKAKWKKHKSNVVTVMVE